jgi:hypothetical protein
MTKSRKIGPFSRDRSLSTLDKRTKAGRVLRSTLSDLTAHVGGDPSAAEALLIQSAALKATRLFLLSEKLVGGGEIGEDGDHHCLAWLNSMRQDLTALGLARRVRDVTPSLVHPPSRTPQWRPRRRPEASTCSPPPPPRRQSHLKSP